MRNYRHLRKDGRRSAEASKFLGRNITVFWNNEFENFVIYLNGKYWTELLTGEKISYTKLKRMLFKTHPDNSRAERKEVEERVRLNKISRDADERLRGKDAAIDAIKYGIRNRVSVVT